MIKRALVHHYPENMCNRFLEKEVIIYLNNDKNGSVRVDKAEKVEAFNCARCDQEMLVKHANDWLAPDHPDGE